jgi:hypothetical protein
VAKIASSAFAVIGITSLAGWDFSTTGSLFTDFEKSVRCFGEPKCVVFPSTVREIGELAFEGV